jgi:hypothetical protein
VTKIMGASIQLVKVECEPSQRSSHAVVPQSQVQLAAQGRWLLLLLLLLLQLLHQLQEVRGYAAITTLLQGRRRLLGHTVCLRLRQARRQAHRDS